MGKVVDGVELLRMIRDGEIKDETKITKIKRIDTDAIYYFNGRNIVDEHNISLLRFLDDTNFVKTEFEILSEEDEDEEIDIEAIEELDEYCSTSQRREKINKIIRAMKQINKQMKEK